MTELLMSAGYPMTVFNATFTAASSERRERNDSAPGSVGLRCELKCVFFVFYLLHVCFFIVGIFLSGQLLKNQVSMIIPAQHIPSYGPVLADSSYYGFL